MKLFSKKALALVLTLAMLMSCMVFSFGADAAVSVVCENNYDDGNETNWLSKYGNGNYHADNTDNYAKYYDDNGNGTMLVGFGANGHSGYGLSGYWFYADSVYDSGVGDVKTLGNGKYMIQLKYKLKSINTSRSDVSVAIKFGLAPRWNFYYNATNGASKKRNEFLNVGIATNVVTVGADDLNKGWQTAVGFLDLTTATADEWRPHIMATLGGGYQDGLSGTEILIDEVVISKYDDLSDVTANPNAVSDLMWENDYSNPDSTNWGKYLNNYNDHWDYNFHSSPEGMAYKGKTSAGNYALLEDGYVKMGFGTNEAAESNISVFFLKHQYKTANTSAASAGGYYGHRGTRTSDAQSGDFVPAAGKYAIKFDYQVKSFNTASASSVNIGAGYFTAEKYLDSNHKLSNLAGYSTLLTVDASDVSTEWKTAVGFIDAPSNIWGGLMMYAAVADNGAELTESEVLVDNIEIYGMGTFPTVNVMYNDSVVGSVDGLPGYPVTTLPAADALTMSVPDGYAVQYYTDEACTAPVTGPVICGNTGNTVYAGLVVIPKQAIWENHFDNGTDTNWKANYKGKGDDGASNSGQVGLGSNENYAVLETHDDNTHMTLGFNNDGSTGCLSGFWMYHEGTTTTTAGQPGYAGAGYSPDADAREKGSFRPSIGTYIVKIRYKVANFVNNSKASMDIAVGLGAKWAFYWDTNKSRKDLAVIETLATVTNADESDEWKTAMVAISVPQAEMSLHIFATYTPGHPSNLTGSEVYIDDVQIYTNTIALDQTVNDRTAYLYRGNAGTEEEPIWTNLHSYVGNTEKEGVFTSLRLAAKYTAGDSTGSTIIIDGKEYELLERGIVVGVANGTLDAFNYKWRSSKTTNFDQYWAPDPAVSSDEPTEITFTLRLANMGEAWFTNDTAYQFRSYYKVKDLAIDDETGFYVYGGISEAKTFGQMADTFEKNFWFPSLTTNS